MTFFNLLSQVSRLIVTIGTITLLSPAHTLFAWGGRDCASSTELKQIVDVAFDAAPAAEFFGNGRGSGAAGYSVAVSHPGCGKFLYATGLRDVESHRPLDRRTLHHIGSLTKPLTTAIVLTLNATGKFGPDGLETTVEQFFTPEEIQRLTVGLDPVQPRCPTIILAPNRQTGVIEPQPALCPDLSRLTLRHLLNGNHGLWDYRNEVDQNFNGFLDPLEFIFASAFDATGVSRLSLPPGTVDTFALLTATGILANPAATIGSDRAQDFEPSFGNTGYQLLGIIAEKVSGLSYNDLLIRHVTRPLRIQRMLSLTQAPDLERTIARPYAVTTGAELSGIPENLFGVYPLVDIAKNPAINLYDLDSFIATNGGGGEGSVVGTVESYRAFFAALIEGRLLDRPAQALFDHSFIALSDRPNVSHGFGVFREETPEFGVLLRKSGATPGAESFALYRAQPRAGQGTTVVVGRNSRDVFLPRPNVPPTMTEVRELAERLLRAVIN